MQSVSRFEFNQGDLLGHGAFALVFKGRRKKDHLQVAIKQISLKSVPGKFSSIREKEITILKDLKNAHIVQLFDYLETPSDIFLVMEYCNGGDMGDYLIAKKTLSESSIRHLTRHIAIALEALFSLHIIHRDIKPQNLLLSYPSSSPSSSSSSSSSFSTPKRPFTDATIKLADFGFARYLTGADMAATLCGSPLYMAPEILMGQRYDSSADLWSVGTIIFQCLSGSAPFLANNPHALRKRYEKEKLIPKIPDGTSHYLSDLLVKLLRKDSKERITYANFFQHDFLKDPSSLSSDAMLAASQPPQRVKSSPVPIKRQPKLPPYSTSSSSPRQSISPRHGSSVDVCSFSPSSFSGPPLSHKVGSQASLPYYNAQSPNMDVTDQGFILVDFPGRPNSRHCSVTSSSGHQSSGRNSVSGHTHSNHTPSSGMHYSSLTTPFYQAPPRQVHQQVARGSVDSLTVGTGRMDLPATTTTTTTTTGHFGTNQRNSLGSVPGMIGPSPPCLVPFGKLIKIQQHQQPSSLSGHSPMSCVSSNSYSSGSNTKPLSSSPLSTPSPSSLSSPGTNNTTPHYSGGSMIKYPLSRKNSGTKLSALVEERESRRKNRKTSNSNNSKTSSGGFDIITQSNSKTSSGGFDIITQSCLLNSDDENNNDALEIDEDFALSLNMSLTSSYEDNEGRELQQHHHHQQQQQHHHHHQARKSDNVLTMESSGGVLQFTRDDDVVHFTPVHPRPGSSSAVELKTNSSKMLSTVPKRTASSFSHKRNLRLSRDLNAIHTKAANLVPQQPDPLNSDCLSTPKSSEIVAFDIPFLFSDSPPIKQSQYHHSDDEEKDSEGANIGSLKWTNMRDSLILVEEMRAMARARQGPILLMSISTDLTDSGVVKREQRCSEQLVLYAKVVNILDSLSTQYEMELALNCHEESPHVVTEMINKAKSLQELYLEEAKQVRQEVLSVGKSNAKITVSAERLLFLEALDMCKAALLDEKSERKTECIKRYRRAKVIFRHLLSEAVTSHDKQILNKYIQSAQTRMTHLLS